jgi:hypothetical protein
MVDPATLGIIITGLVGAYKAYADYRAAVATAELQHTPAPAPSPQVTRGKQTAPIVQAAIQRYGDAKEQTTLALFEADPATFEEALQRVLIQLAGRSPGVAAELRALARQDQSRGGTNQNSATVADHATVYGLVVGGNYGRIDSEYHIEKPEHDERSG